MGVMQFIGLVVLYLRQYFDLESANVLAIALSLISVLTIDVNLQALANNENFRQE